MNLAFYRFANWLGKHFIVPIYASVKIEGLENVPREGPLIIVSNHLNDADPCILGSYLPRAVVSLAKIELFKVPGLAQFLRLYGAIPVRRDEADLSALRRAGEALEAGLAVCIFAEGRRSGRRARLTEAKPGAGLIAMRTGAPIVPLAITGSQEMSLPFLFLRPNPWRKVNFTFGEPYHVERPARLNAEAAKEGTDRIMRTVAALLPPEYRGYYGDEPAPDVATPSGGSGE